MQLPLDTVQQQHGSQLMKHYMKGVPLKCPTCKAITPPRAANSSYPFCSKRCKMVDLGHWFGESFVLSRPVNPEVDREAFEALILAAPGEENV